MWMMRLKKAGEDVGVGEDRHLHSARAVNGIAADCLIGEQRRGGGMALYPGVKFLRPLVGIHRFTTGLPLFEPAANGFDTDVQHVIGSMDQASLNGLAD